MKTAALGQVNSALRVTNSHLPATGSLAAIRVANRGFMMGVATDGLATTRAFQGKRGRQQLCLAAHGYQHNCYAAASAPSRATLRLCMNGVAAPQSDQESA